MLKLNQQEKKRPEVHEKFLDVQFLASGRENLALHQIQAIMKLMKDLMKEI